MLYNCLESLLKKQGILLLYACIARPPKEDEHLTLASIHFHTRMGFHTVGEFPAAASSSTAGTTWSGWKNASPNPPTLRSPSPRFLK